jgi:hypothetical protein
MLLITDLKCFNMGKFLSIIGIIVWSNCVKTPYKLKEIYQAGSGHIPKTQFKKQRHFGLAKIMFSMRRRIFCALQL